MAFVASVSAHDALERLTGRYLELCASAENQRRLRHAGVSYSTLPEFPLLARVTGADLRASYLDPEAFARFTLAQRIYRFERWRDCTPLTMDIGYWPGVILETSALGMTPVYPEGEDPWIDHRPFVHSLADVEGLSASFDPAKGVVKTMMEMSEHCRERLPGFTVYVQAWERGPVGTAMDLMGTEEFLMNTAEEPGLVHALMRKVTDVGYAWSAGRAAHLRERGFTTASSVSPGTGAGADMIASSANFTADEVNMPMLSPGLYEEFVLPYEREVVERHGGLNYYHSCGCLDPFLPALASLRPATQHVSYWTSLAEAVRVYSGTPTCLQKTLHPLRDVLEQDAKGMRTVLENIRALADGRVKYCVIANGIDSPDGDVEATLAKCDQWVETAARVFENH